MQAAQARATACAARARAAPRKRGAPAGTRRAVLPRMHPARPRPTPAPPRASCRSGRSTLLFDDVVSLRALHTTILPLPSATNGRPASPLPPVQGQPKTAEKSAEGTWSTRGCPHSTPAFARLPHLLAPGWHLHTVVFAFWPFGYCMGVSSIIPVAGPRHGGDGFRVGGGVVGRLARGSPSRRSHR